MTFRKDINGLRAIAVVAVVLFHFDAPGFGGGFAGVDIFFVISGYLMTSILFPRIERGQLGYGSFLALRLLRIYPTMAVLLAAAIVYGYLCLAPLEFTALAKTVEASTLSVANIFFYQQSSDYFALAQKSNWLLHLWSLGVEAQFYVMIPAVLFIASAAKRQVFVLSATFLASLGACVLLSRHSQEAAFYLLPTRAWEFLAGSLCCVVKNPLPDRAAKALPHLGLIIIAGCVFTLNERMTFPGYFAIAPVVGVALVVFAPSGNLILDNPASQFFGTISYSLYLWHWPIWVLGKQYGVANGAGPILLVLISVAIASVSYFAIERPIASLKHNGARKAPVLMAVSAGSFSVAAASAAIIFLGGVQSRVPPLIREWGHRFAVDVAQRPTDGVCFATLKVKATDLPPRCFEPAILSSKPTVFVWGDSLAAHFSYGLIATDRNIHLDGETSANCIPFLSVHDIGNADCQGNNKTALEAVSKLKPQVVVLFAEWRRAQTRGYDVPAEIKKTVSAITKLGVRTLVIGPSLEWSPALPQKLLQAYFKLGSIPVRMTDNSQGPGRDLDRRLSNALLGTSASYFSVYNLWCDKADCETVIKEGDRVDMIAYDTAHLTIPAAKQLANAAFDSFHFVDVISSVKKLEVTR